MEDDDEDGKETKYGKKWWTFSQNNVTSKKKCSSFLMLALHFIERTAHLPFFCDEERPNGYNQSNCK